MVEGSNTSKNWKQQFYTRYGSLFGVKYTKEAYDGFVPYGKDIIKKCFPIEKSVAILDIGCGIGGFLKVALDAGYTNIQGIDISNESVATAQATGLRQVRLGNVFEVLSKTDDEMYDVILCLDFLEHFVKEDIIRILHQIRRVLKPTGRIIIHVPNSEGIFGSKIRYADFTHEQAFTCNSLSQVLRHAGFNDVVCFEDKPVVHGFTSLIRRCLWILLTIPFRLLHAAETGSFKVKLSQNILAVGRTI